jgi:hypothetical protein
LIFNKDLPTRWHIVSLGAHNQIRRNRCCLSGMTSIFLTVSLELHGSCLVGLMKNVPSCEQTTRPCDLGYEDSPSPCCWPRNSESPLAWLMEEGDYRWSYSEWICWPSRVCTRAAGGIR